MNSLNVIGQAQRRRLCFVAFVWSCFCVVPGRSRLFWVFPAYYDLSKKFSGSFHFLRTTISQNILTSKLSKTELDVTFHYKVVQAILQGGIALMQYNVDQVLLEHFLIVLYQKLSGGLEDELVITLWRGYYKADQFLLQSEKIVKK